MIKFFRYLFGNNGLPVAELWVLADVVCSAICITVPDGNGAQDTALVQDLQIPLGLLHFLAERLDGQQKGSGIRQ